MFIESFKNLNIYKNIYKKDSNNREINIYKFENFVVKGVNLYYPNILLYNERLILPILEKTMSLENQNLKEFECKRESENIKTNECKEPLSLVPSREPALFFKGAIFFFIYNLGNYYHFLYDSLPYLISYLELKKEIKNLKLLIQYPNKQKQIYPFVYEFLELLDIKKKDLVFVDPDTLYSQIYISTSYTHDIDSNLPPRKEIYDFYQKMVKSVNLISNIQLYDKIYISRRTHLNQKSNNIGTDYTSRRKLVNEDELVEKLKKEGYVEIFTENLNTLQKILLFNNAKNICGCIGGGIANVVFCKKEAKLEAIISPGFLEINNRFKYCLEWVNVDYNTKTEHLEKGEFKKYMRVKYKDITSQKEVPALEEVSRDIAPFKRSAGSREGTRDILGEIEDYDEEYLTLKTAKYNTGWEREQKYEMVKVKKTEVKKLDNGLNSQFILHL